MSRRPNGFVVCVLIFPQGLWGLVTTTVPHMLRRTRRAG